MTQLGRHIDVQHFTFELGTYSGRHLDAYDRCRKCIHDVMFFCCYFTFPGLFILSNQVIYVRGAIVAGPKSRRQRRYRSCSEGEQVYLV